MAGINDTQTFDQVAAQSDNTKVPTFERGISELGSGSLESTLRQGALSSSLQSGLGQSDPTQLGSQAFGSKVHSSHELPSAPQSFTSNIDTHNPASLESTRGTAVDPFASTLDTPSYPLGSADISGTKDQPKLAGLGGSSALQSNLGRSANDSSAGVGAGAVSPASSHLPSAGGLEGDFKPTSGSSSAFGKSSTSTSSFGQAQTSTSGSGDLAPRASGGSNLEPTNTTDQGTQKHNDHVTNLVTAVAGVALTAPKAAVEILSGHAQNASASLQQTAEQQGLTGVAQTVGNTLSGAAASAQPYVSSAGQSVAGVAQTVQAQLSSVRDPNAPPLTQKAGELGSSISATASSYATTASTTVADLAHQAQEALHHLGERVGLVSPVAAAHDTGVTLPAGDSVTTSAGVKVQPTTSTGGVQGSDFRAPSDLNDDLNSKGLPLQVQTPPTAADTTGKTAPILSGKEVRPDVSYSQI